MATAQAATATAAIAIGRGSPALNNIPVSRSPPVPVCRSPLRHRHRHIFSFSPSFNFIYTPLYTYLDLVPSSRQAVRFEVMDINIVHGFENVRRKCHGTMKTTFSVCFVIFKNKFICIFTIIYSFLVSHSDHFL